MNGFEFLATGTGASFVGFLISQAKAWLANRKLKKKHDNFIMGMRSVAKVYAAMYEIMKKTAAERILLLEVTNGGNAPKPGSIMYARAIEAQAPTSEQAQEMIRRYESVRIDDNYINMVLQSANTHRPYCFDVDRHEDCLLRNIYITEGVRYSEVFHLFTDTERQKMFIMTIASFSNLSFDEIKDRAQINYCVDEIRDEFASYSKMVL